jgi:transposase
VSADRPNHPSGVKEATVMVVVELMFTSGHIPSSPVDEVGRELGHKTVEATTTGHQAAVMWARERFGSQVRWAIEDCRHLSARLERDLLAAGQQVVRYHQR